MTMKAGVWIDRQKAVVIVLTDEREDILQISADRNASPKHPCHIRLEHSYTRNDYENDDRSGRKAMAHLSDFYDQVLNCIQDADSILILGPREATNEFRKRVASKKLKGHIAEMKTVDKLTDWQIAEYVRQHYQ